MKKINIVMVEPEIPQNTGNVARTCACTGASLHLVKPLGFEIDDKKMKRAGLDYWNSLDITYYDNLAQFLEMHKEDMDKMYFFTTKGQKRHSDVQYPDGAYLVFGKETKGLPEELLHDNYQNAVRIPMRDKLRSLNLSNSICVAVYEVLRQW
ncbi:MAG: tRNA (uridine(34)/cytosine(34)/5-carboxymethylaminomethyluridine(34)-2'-O)-methyltransferase TrmL, partial [Clostridia bacterium]|nr:tRNA (uridine(34)/cytosine(34)/5-carboxymethylaminomethyluridine(34)-2'-O)-methyltransferase TrmL [Clostridia bacterium]